jgi:O-antigen biosynthesis protein WbqP
VNWRKRLFDLTLALVSLPLLLIPIVLISIAVKLTSRGPVLYTSQRVGQYNRLFIMPKFRTMRTDTPELATHLLKNPRAYLTPIGSLLRLTSLDELPQLWCILRGEMSFVGPRPALHNQDDLIAARTKAGVDVLVPGLTGWAQVNGRDELPIAQKVTFDHAYLEQQSFMMDLKILWLTAMRVWRAQGVSH